MIKTDNIEEATHWTPTEDEGAYWDWTHVTIGNEYELKYDDSEQEYYIVNDEGIMSLIFLCHNGEFVIINNG